MAIWRTVQNVRWRDRHPKRVKADAYRFAEGSGPPSAELLELSYIDRFGVRAVFGRDELSHGEIQRMILAENVKNAYLARRNYRDEEKNENWAEWASKHPDDAALLAGVERDLDAD